MVELVWEQKMSVGIDSIDNDHKQLIAVLAQLTSAKNEGDPIERVNLIFEKLEAYCQSHFAREEALLLKVGYQQFDEHKKSHQVFINKIPQLKQKWLKEVTESEAIKEEIITFLQQWLVKHILKEDLDYVEAVQGSEDYKTQNSPSSSVNFVSMKLSQYLTLSHRVFITTLLPVVALLILSFSILKNNAEHYQSISLVLELNKVIEQVNGLTHSLQAERGLSTGYTSSNYRSFSQQLSLRRKKTDTAIKHFLNVLDNPDYDEIKVNINEYMVNAKNSVANLSRHRMQLDQKLVGEEDTNYAYTQVIAQLLSVSDHLVHIDVDARYINDITAINAILRYKEYLGQIRAIGMKMVKRNQKTMHESVDVILLMGKQHSTLNTFVNSASAKQSNICGEYCDVIRQHEKLDSSYQYVMQLDDENARMTEWFTVMSNQVDHLNEVLNALINDFNDHIYTEGEKIKTDGLLIIIALSLFSLLAIFFSIVLNHSIISPVKKLTFALNKLSEGQTNMHFTEFVSKDDIGTMQLAFEKLRRKLLKGDIYKATVSQQKEEIQYRKSQQDHFQQLALTDALTGAVNRHHFNEVIQDEIGNVSRQKGALSIMLLDIDHFKVFNDTYGHGVGDEMLVIFYKTCVEAMRSSDVVARIGGEEFVIIMPGTKLLDAKVFAERLRYKVSQLKVNKANEELTMTVSIGVSQWKKEFIDAESFVDNADKSLYQAKNNGRNQVVIDQS